MKILLPISALLLLTACSIDPKDYESQPVTVQTAAGPVVCQLYTKNIVRWDRAITRPDNMSVETADQICVNEGLRQRDGSEKPAAASEQAAAL
ncbi:hypothetical protein F8A10_08390 [Paracoccus kondratievae]|uniref:Uncharacterized protein n=1 Tax=Paracoccus kondratievae TaxID=135740 RepID=A0AAD3P0Y2_9RHOB|nr:MULTISPECIES: hypothetical protein [Paracoccus]QFQ87443.1 hypothetical protein F8A10_08390 [Paracoccus kondratievae]GLK65423.1 hypothetical protein GCM10017635_28980 [Paracoccus kondratievae]